MAASSAGLAWSADYGLPANIQDGNILHCFNWTMADVKAELPNIAAAGYGSVQLSPLQRPDIKTGSSWHDLYRPYDLAFKSSGMGSEQDLKSLCDEAAKYGIKIIVDVVANHVDKTAGYHDTWWDSNGRVRWNGGINYGDRYSITHGQLGDYGDINSEDAEVCARGKAYVQKLHDLGVKGVRWDAAKHIALPSEGCNFWSAVTSVAGMYHYGEILDAPGPNASIIKEYTNYMSVTDNKYSNGAARENGGIPYGYGGAHVVDYGCPDTKMVYWGESHDTYANDEWSQNVDQSVIDRAYASFACRNGATALYLARPNARGFNNIKVGKGTSAFKGKAVSEVNKFRNAMVGKADWCEAAGNTFTVTRKDGGAVIVMKGSGNVSVKNGGGYCPAGTYTDKVSGGTFTVTSTTISGNIGQSGIAVIYNGGGTPTPNPNPDPTPDPEPAGEHYVYYDGTFSSPQVWAWTTAGECTTATAWPGDNMIRKNNMWYWEVPAGKSIPTQIIIHEGDNKIGGGDLTYVDRATYHQDGSYTQGTTPNPNPNPDPTPGDGTTVYFDNSSANWGSVYCYQWADENNRNASWPGEQMTLVKDNIYSYTCSTVYPNVIFNNGVGGTAGNGQTADLVLVNGHIYKADGSHQQYQGGDNPNPNPNPDPDPDPDPTPGPTGNYPSLNTTYYKTNPNGQLGTNKTINMSHNGAKSTSALTTWTADELIAQGVARDVAQAIKGKHERPIVDSYAVYAAYDAENLYIGVQYVYTVWDLYGEGKQPGESKPYNMDGRLMIAFDLDPNKNTTGVLTDGNTVWDADGQYNTFNNGMDCMFLGSTKPGVGQPSVFFPNAAGKFSYTEAGCCKAFTGSYAYQDGLLPSITNIWGQKEFEYDPEALTGTDGFVDLKGEIDATAHTFYEYKFPLSLLGISESYIKNQGIGVMVVDTYGQGAIGSTPYDPTCFDNVKTPYSKDPSSSAEKEDTDLFTYAMARIGKGYTNQSGVEAVEIEAAEEAEAEYFNLQGIRVYDPAPGVYLVRRGDVVTKEIVK